MSANHTQTLILTFNTNKATRIRVQINQPKLDASASEIKTIMEELIALGAITNNNEELIRSINGAGLIQRTIENINL